MSYSNTNVFLLVFDLTEPETLASISSKWLAETHSNAPKAAHILVGAYKTARDDALETMRASGGQANVVTPQQVDGHLAAGAPPASVWNSHSTLCRPSRPGPRGVRQHGRCRLR